MNKTSKVRFTSTKWRAIGIKLNNNLDRDGHTLVEKNLQRGKLKAPTEFQYQKISALELYRNKDGVEKIFRSLKNDICEKRSRTKSLAAMRGSFFISFIAVIILSHITHVMKQNDLFKDFTKQELLRCLAKLRTFTLANDQTILAEVTKKQKSIFDAFKIEKLIPSYNLAGF